MSDERRAMRDLILGYDDLDDADRKRVDAFLEGHPEFRATVDRLREVETSPGPEGQLDSEGGAPDPLSDLGPAERKAAEESLGALLGLVAPSRSAGREPPRMGAWLGRLGRWRLVVPALAAAAALVVLFRPSSAPLDPFESVFATRPSGTRAGTTADPVASWKTGDRFVIAYTLDEPSFVVAVHVDVVGEVTLLYPDRATATLQVQEPSTTLFIPPSASGESWALSGDGGIETLLVAAFARAPDLEQLETEMARITSGTDRPGAIAAVTALIENRGGGVRMVELAHQNERPDGADR